MAEFFQPNPTRAVAKQLHVNLSEDDEKRLAKLTHSMQMSASDVVRTLIRRTSIAEKPRRKAG